MPYRVCMAQLALLATQRNRAQMPGDWLDGLVARGGDCWPIAEDLKSVLLPEMRQLPFDRCSGWFERTRRHSFYV
jgi:hypothetical protein